VEGHSSRKLISGQELLHMKSYAVVLEVNKPSIYSVKGKAPYGIGMKRKPDDDKTFFVVSHLYPEGSIAKWNEEFPNMPVSIGDIVREVNGVQGSAAEVQKMLATDPDEEKDLLVFHFPPPQPPPPPQPTLPTTTPPPPLKTTRSTMLETWLKNGSSIVRGEPRMYPPCSSFVYGKSKARQAPFEVFFFSAFPRANTSRA